MKKNIIFSVLVTTLILAPFSISFAQELTRENLRAIVPSLTQAVSSLGNVLQNEIARRNVERNMLISMNPVLNSVATRVNQMNNNLTQSQIDSLVLQLTPIVNVVSDISNRRLQFQENLDPVVAILGEITETITEAYN